MHICVDGHRQSHRSAAGQARIPVRRTPVRNRGDCLWAEYFQVSTKNRKILFGSPRGRIYIYERTYDFLWEKSVLPWFAEQNYQLYDFVLLSNDVKEWSKYLFELHGLHKYFKDSIVSGEIHMRKPESRIFLYAVQRIRCNPQKCIFVDNSVRNLDAAQEIGINTVLFNRDHETYSGNIVNNFRELDHFLKGI